MAEVTQTGDAAGGRLLLWSGDGRPLQWRGATAVIGMDQPYATVLGALIGALLGSLVAAWAAWLRFRQERAFDRQLQWYETTIRAVHFFAQKLEIALTHQADVSPGVIREPPDESSSKLAELIRLSWREAQSAQNALERACVEAPLFGSERAVSIAGKIARTVQAVSDETDGIDPPSLVGKEREEAIARIENLPEKLRAIAEPLAREARSHLGIK